MSRFVRPMPEAEQIEFLDALRRFLGLSPWAGSRRAELEKQAVRCPIRFSDRYNVWQSSEGCRQVRKVGHDT
jgi:hypothetical protein